MIPSLSTHPQIAAGPRLGRRQEWLLYGWFLLLVLAPLLLMIDETTFADQRHVDIRTHSAVELFCGVTGLMIATLVLVLSRQYQERALKLFATGFFCMGSLDILHALTPVLDYPGLFVGFHTLSTLSGGAFLCAGAARYYLDHNPEAPPLRQSGELLSMLAVLALIAIAYHLILPPGRLDDLYSFSALARRTHELASLLYAGAALLAFLFFRATRQRLVLIAAGLLLVFSESAYLFRFSHLWDTTWWLWHAVKVGFYIGTLVVIAAGLVVALRAVERARVAQLTTNRQLAHAHASLGLVHHELQIRNAMVNASINARTLDQTLQVVESALAELLGPCRYRLTLRVPTDEVAEWERDMRRQTLHWDVSVTDDAMPCARLVQAVGGNGDETVQTCTPTRADYVCMCLALRAQDQVFGYLRMQVQHAHPARIKYEQLEVIAAEIGPILHNALLHYRWNTAVAFRSALTRMAALLGSTLELPQVLQSVCRESAQLLQSEAAALFLAEEQGEHMRLASRCMFGTAAEDGGGRQPSWVDSAEGAALFARLRETGRPLALVKPESPQEPMPFPLGTEGCQWGALVMFPLFDAGRLMALMIIMRRDRIAFSRATLEQGELLAEQVRGAIANARAYQAVRRSNDQLRHSEQERMRAERLAVLGQMAASVAHEVRNPLSAINNCLAVLRRKVPTEAQGAMPAIEIIGDEVQRLERLTRNFISFGRASQRPLVPAQLDHLVHRVCEGVEAHIRQEGMAVELQQELRGASTAVLFDADGFQELLWNLLLNAVQAMQGRGRVRVRLVQRATTTFLAVSDDGPGVALADRARIFEPFYSQKSQGAGLGLAIVRQHVEGWGGRLRLWSPPGACFTLRFPVTPAGATREP